MTDRPDDLVLLSRLSEALPVPVTEPSSDEIRALRMIVASTPPAARQRMRKWVAGLLAGAVVVGGGTAYAVGSDNVPRPVLGVASRIGLPVESPDERDLRRAEERLAEELEEGDADDVADAAERVAEERADLVEEQREGVDDVEEITEDRSGSNRGPSADEPESPGDDNSGPSENSGSSGSGSGSGSSGSDDEPDSDDD